MRRFVLLLLTTLGLVATVVVLKDQSCRRRWAPVPQPKEPPDQPASDAAADGSAPQARCHGVKRDGQQCSRASEPDSRYCWQHSQ